MRRGSEFITAYEKQIWVDRQVQYPNRYVDQNGNILTLIRSPGTVTENGSLFNAERMNHIENGIKEIDDNYLYFTESTTLNDLVIKSNLLGNNTKISASEIAVVNNDEVETLDNYLDNINKYSTDDEIIIGKWIDDKPIYRKVVIIGDVLSSNTGTTHVSTGTSDIDKVIRTYGGGFFENLFLDWNFVNANGWTSLHFAKNDNKFLAQIKTYELTDAYAIIEYTKTTDSGANS